MSPGNKLLLVLQELVEVPVEVAALIRRRTLGTVEVPTALAKAVENAAQSGTRSTKLQRKQTAQLVDSLRQLSRTPGKGGASMNLIDANAGRQQKRRKRVCLHPHMCMTFPPTCASRIRTMSLSHTEKFL